jgi:hypothetical protein
MVLSGCQAKPPVIPEVPPATAIPASTLTADEQTLAGLGGLVVDFLIAVMTGNEGKALGYLAASYRDASPDLGQATGISGKPDTFEIISSQLTENGATVEAVLRYADSTQTLTINLQPAEDRWWIVDMIPD